MSVEISAILPNTPAVPAIGGVEWPVGFAPVGDVIEMSRSIYINLKLCVVAKLSTAGGKTTITVAPREVGYSKPGTIPLEHVGPVVVAMNILRDWVVAESARLVIKPEPEVEKSKPPVPARAKPADCDEDESDVPF
jgi:hypothetical protein